MQNASELLQILEQYDVSSAQELLEKLQKNTYVPFWLKRTKELKGNEKFILADIISLTRNKEKCCYASQSYLANQLGVSRETVNKILKRLKVKGYIFYESSKKKQRNQVFLRIDPITGEKIIHSSCQDVTKRHTCCDETSQGCDETSHNTNSNKLDILSTNYRENLKIVDKISGNVNSPSMQTREFFEAVEEKTERYFDFIERFCKKYNRQPEEMDRILKAFKLYWTEYNHSGTKQKWQLEQTFEINKRLSTWLKNEQKYSFKKGNIKQNNSNKTTIIR